MISMEKLNKRVRLDTYLFTTEDYYVYWRQYVRPDGSLVKTGMFYLRVKHCNGWCEVLRKRILNKKK